MKRGDIWTMAGGKDYAGKPRPAAIIQDDRFQLNDSVTVCPLTSDQMAGYLFRLPVEPNEHNGLNSSCRLMVDKITTVPRAKLGYRIGQLDDNDVLRLNQAITIFLGLTGSAPPSHTEG